MPSQEHTIRRARPADIDEIVAIEREAFPDPWDERTLHEALAIYPGAFFVAGENGQVTGFIAGGLEDTGEELYGHIMNLAVTPACRGQGIGALLVRRLEQQFALEGATGVQLEVRVSNTGAQQFYRRLGYQEVFTVANYYGNGEDALVMMKWFRF
ncbi:alanine acetyltransferase [Methanoculleus taiwanensis]|uniref:Alanine acetyltransferase n=1 Tax=Methanoculleus taiwanensis TaxID=1550565 RepID=A0A498H0U3_9EURY|nr:ribosomal protein S18-alanine N-acetyltransferase [Methanoculleus taiwanensis]RXE55650.1 alanine acetyltransferase [Methanoculleus taiwanensis]